EQIARELLAALLLRLREVRRLQAEHVRQIEARIDRIQRVQTAGEEPGADEEHERHRQLAHYQQPLRPPPPAPPAHPPPPPPDPAIAPTGSCRNRSRGAQANSSAIAIDTASVKPSTHRSSVISPVRFVNRDV